MKKNNTFYTKIIGQLARFGTMEKMLEYLRQFNFVFVEMDTYEEEFPDNMDFKPREKNYSIMVRELAPGKGVWDDRMMVLVKLWGKRNRRVAVYLNHKFHIRLDKGWKDEHDINFKKLNIKLKFPEGLNYDERKKWRYEHKKIERNPQHVASPFYTKWKDQVIHL